MVAVHASVSQSGPLATASGAERALARAITGAMRETTGLLKQSLRDDVNRAGLGSRLANTWRGETYPQKSASVSPKGYIWSKAPEIISFYDSGNVIVPINGHRYLAIPTAAARAITGKKRRRLSVPEVEAKLGRKIIIIKGKNGHLLGLFDQSLKRGGGRKRGVPNKRDLVLLYTFVPMVAGQKRLDVLAEAQAAAAILPAAIERKLSQ